MTDYKTGEFNTEISSCIIQHLSSNISLNIPLTECHDESDIYKKPSETKDQYHKYRTKLRAKAAEDMPDKIPVITIHPWEHALSFHQNENSFMYVESEFQAGMCRQASDQAPVCSDGKIPDIDLPILHFLYGMVLKKWSKNVNEIIQNYDKDPKQMLSYNITIYVPDFIKASGISSNFNKDSICRVIEKIKSYSDITGMVKEKNISGKNEYGYYSVLQFVGYDESDNTITFSCPYINRIIQKVLYSSVICDKHGNMMRSKSGRLNMMPSHSFRMNPGILKERNKRAAEVACMLAALIDKAGSSTAHIRFQTIINRYEKLKQDLDSASSTFNKNRILKSTFSKAYEFLEQYTDLREQYKNIRLPDPSDKDLIPTMKTLDRVIEFPHEGRIKKIPKKQTD